MKPIPKSVTYSLLALKSASASGPTHRPTACRTAWAVLRVWLLGLGLWPAALPAQTVSNLLVNGDFSQGTNAWTAYPGWDSIVPGTKLSIVWTGMHCLPSQGTDPYLRIDVPLGTPAYVEQTVTLPATPARLTVRSWGFFWPAIATVSVKDAAS